MSNVPKGWVTLEGRRIQISNITGKADIIKELKDGDK